MPVAAARSKDIAFVIEVSGWQGPVWQQDPVRVEAELRADGFSAKDIDSAVQLAKKRMDLIRGTGPFADLDAIQQKVKRLPWFEYVHLCDETLFYAARRVVREDLVVPWDRVHCPVLVIFGDKDTSSGPPAPMIDVIRGGLAKAGNTKLEVKVFAGADHSLCKAKTGGRKEQREGSRRPGTGPDFVDGYLETMTTWLRKTLNNP